MKKILFISTLALGTAFTSFTTARATESNAQPATATSDADAYTATIEKRTMEIIKLLDIQDSANATKAHDVIIAQYRALNTWHEAHDAKLKELRKQANDKDAAVSGPAKEQLEQTQASLKQLHNDYLAKLSAVLSPEQVEKVKDKMTYGKVQFTMAGYLHVHPDLTEAEKAHILDMLKEAREQAMDGGSSEEKTAIFTKYKGKINNYLSAQGHSAKAKKDEKSEPAK